MQPRNFRGVGIVGAVGRLTPPDFVRSVTLLDSRGADYAHHITTLSSPGFSDLPTDLNLM